MTEKKILIFGGTTEGRKLTEYLAARKVRVHVCVVTAYGESLLPESESVTAESSRMDVSEMCHRIREYAPAFVVDATHPYAREVSRNIKQACESCGKPYLRLLREEGTFLPEHDGAKDGTAAGTDSKTVWVESAKEAAEYLADKEGKILLTTGSKELEAFTRIPDYRERVYARVLSLPSVVEKCHGLGLEGRHLICMQGPFSAELNLAMLREFQIRFLVTKEAGSTGGFPEKREAAEKAGAVLVVIGRPEEREGFSEEELYAYLKQELSLSDSWELAIVGIGMGAEESLTLEGKKACREAGLLIGARRMLEAAATEGQVTEEAYLPGDILAAVKRHPSIRKAAVVLSGDPGFYSGAKRLLEALQEESDFQVQVVPGVSSVSYFCAKLHTSWEDAAVLSLHGREDNLIWAVERHKKTIVLGSGAESVRKICETLKVYGYGALTVTAGDRLSYPEEDIRKGSAEEMSSYEGEGPVILLIENPDGGESAPFPGVPDEAFVRGKVPMTKEEVRCIALSKLRLGETSVVYDIGAGTGSVAVEAARMAFRGRVYAVERNPEGFKLIRENQEALRAAGLTVIPGEAPEALEDLPAPDQVFIGGSGGRLSEILAAVLRKNPRVRVVITAISLETVAEAKACMEKIRHREEDVVQVSVSRARKAGNYHLMTGLNPVWIFSFTCDEEEQ